jgi:hypothetical protein
MRSILQELVELFCGDAHEFHDIPDIHDRFAEAAHQSTPPCSLWFDQVAMASLLLRLTLYTD